ncbi:MAG: 50S ribosomal protein L3 [Nanoarchaeota archaeon]|nr:50S ribosomal protein L3 [Nanoarchaeota archaeon]
MGHVIGDKDSPRRGSMQFWPRSRAKRAYPSITNAPELSETLLTSFSGYKVGMTHITVIDNLKNSPSKGQEITVPVTVIECPPLTVFSLRFYSKNSNGLSILSHVNSDSYDKELNRKLVLKGKKAKEKDKKKPANKEDVLKMADNIERITAVVHTHPKLTSLGKKKPEVMEVIISGDIKEAINKGFELLGKQVSVNDVFKEGEQIDTFSVTKGKGFQGSVKRFGVKIGRHKAEKVKRKAMTLGAWSPRKVDHRVPQHGQMGYQVRCDYNKWLMKIVEPEKVNVKGGFINYGEPKNTVLLIKGSIPGPKKRLIRLRKSIRPNKVLPKQVPELIYLSISSKQG